MLPRRRAQSRPPLLVHTQSAPVLPTGLAFRELEGRLHTRVRQRRATSALPGKLAPAAWKLRRFILEDDVLRWYKSDGRTERGRVRLESASFSASLDAKEARAVAVPKELQGLAFKLSCATHEPLFLHTSTFDEWRRWTDALQHNVYLATNPRGGDFANAGFSASTLSELSAASGRVTDDSSRPASPGASNGRLRGTSASSVGSAGNLGSAENLGSLCRPGDTATSVVRSTEMGQGSVAMPCHGRATETSLVPASTIASNSAMSETRNPAKHHAAPSGQLEGSQDAGLGPDKVPNVTMVNSSIRPQGATKPPPQWGARKGNFPPPPPPPKLANAGRARSATASCDRHAQSMADDAQTPANTRSFRLSFTKRNVAGDGGSVHARASDEEPSPRANKATSPRGPVMHAFAPWKHGWQPRRDSARSKGSAVRRRAHTHAGGSPHREADHAPRHMPRPGGAHGSYNSSERRSGASDASSQMAASEDESSEEDASRDGPEVTASWVRRRGARSRAYTVTNVFARTSNQVRLSLGRHRSSNGLSKQTPPTQGPLANSTSAAGRNPGASSDTTSSVASALHHAALRASGAVPTRWPSGRPRAATNGTADAAAVVSVASVRSRVAQFNAEQAQPTSDVQGQGTALPEDGGRIDFSAEPALRRERAATVGSPPYMHRLQSAHL